MTNSSTIMIAAIIICAGISIPVATSPEASANSSWRNTSDTDFNQTGADFGGTWIIGNMTGARIEVKPQNDGMWQNTSPTGGVPFNRHAYGIAALPGDDKAILYGGSFGLSKMNDTWEYHLGTNTWTNRTPTASAALKRLEGVGMTAVANTNKMVMYGGNGNGFDCCETWMYDYSTNYWTLKTTSGPSARTNLGLATIYTQASVLLFGGTSGSTFYNNTWLYNTTNNIWTNVTTANSPSPRRGPMMAGIPGDDKVLLFGGLDGNGYFNDTWIYDISDAKWYNKTNSNSPAGRALGGLAPLFGDDKLVMAGGIGSTFPTDVRVYDVSDNTWYYRTPSNSPSGRCYVSLASFDGTDKMMMFGGRDSGMNYLNETFVYNYNIYPSWAYYASAAFDTGGPSNFQYLNFSAGTPAGTDVRVELRTGPTLGSLAATGYAGPSGTGGNYSSNGTIWPGHSGHRWVQYRIFMTVTDLDVTPSLSDISIDYNRLPGQPGVIPQVEWTSESHPDFSWTYNDTDSSGQRAFEWNLANSSDFSSLTVNITEYSANSTYTPSSAIPDGIWYWRVRTIDTDGGLGPFSAAQMVRIDTTPPASFFPVPDNTNWTNGQLSVAFSTADASSGIARYEGSIDGGAFHNRSSPWVLPALTDGEHQVRVRAVDNAGNYVDGCSTVRIDTGCPGAFTPSASPSNWTNGSVSVEFTAVDSVSGIASYQGCIDSGAFSDQTSPWVLPALGNGEHAVRIRAIDGAGNSVDGCVTVRVDKTSPEAFLPEVNPSGWTNLDPQFTFSTRDSLSGIFGYSISIDNGPFCVTASPVTLKGLANGMHNITIRASDNAGNRYDAVVTALVDRASPDIPGISCPPGLVNTTAEVSFFANDTLSGIDRYEVKIDNGTFTARSSPLTLSAIDDGLHRVTVRAYDNAGNFNEDFRTFTLDRSPPSGVTISINSGASVTSKSPVTLTLGASDNLSSVSQMCFSNDGTTYSGWEQYSPSKVWELSAGNGQKTVYFKVMDGAGNEAGVSSQIQLKTVSPPPPNPPVTGGPGGFLLPLIAVIGAAAIAGGLLAVRSRKKKQAQQPVPAAPAGTAFSRPVPAPLAPSAVAVPAPEPVIVAPAPVAAQPEAPRTPEGATVAAAPAYQSGASEGSSAPASVRAPVPDEDSCAVDDVFLMYKDGRLIQHTTRRLKADMDVDIMTSMLKAVQEFVKESLGQADGSELGSMEYGDSKILLEKGKDIILAAVIAGPEPKGFRAEMRHTIRSIEAEYAAVLPEWNGTIAELSGSRKFMGQLCAYRAPDERAAAAAKSEVSLACELEFYQGFVRLKVAIKNGMPAVITHVSFRLVQDRDILRLDRVEPTYPADGGEVQLGILGAKEKKAVAFYLDPQICTETYIDGILTFKDATGNLHSLTMPKKMASVVCPIMYTDENINTAMLRRMVESELDKNDSKVFSIPAALDASKAFEVAKAAVQHHDIRLVRELREDSPFVGEAWYFGKVKGRQDKLVVRVRVLSEKNALEFFVASTSTLMLTGMLAELRSDLNTELDVHKMPVKITLMSDSRKVQDLATVRTLLSKASQSESNAGDTDQRPK